MSIFLAVSFVVAQGLVRAPAWIQSARLDRLEGETGYRLTLQAKGAPPLVRAFHSYDPPNLYTVNDAGQGPAAVLHGFDPQADFLTVFAYRAGRWHASETIYARYGITFAHGRPGEVSIEARIPHEVVKGTKGAPQWDTVRYRIDRGALIEATSGRSR